MTKEDIAKATYQVNRAYCESLGDFSFGPWQDAPEWQRQANRAGVIFHLCHPEAEAGESHDSWLAMKEAEGWKYGYKKDPEKKEHPCMVPFDQLPANQQAKDFLFKAVVDSMKRFLEES
jgi:hypothetical protein